MPLLRTTRPCLYVEADAYILIHHGNSESDFMSKRMFRCAGPQMLEAYNNSGIVPYGDPVITPGYGLKAKYVIHILQSKELRRKDSTQEQYLKALLLAQAHHCESVIFTVPSYNYEEATKVNSACRSFARETDMTVYLSGSSDRYSGLSLELQRKLEKFLGIDREAIELEEFRRSITEINSPYEEAHDSEQDGCIAKLIMPEASCAEDFSDREFLPQATEAPRPQATFPKAAKPKLQSGFRAIQEFLKKNDAGFKDTLLKYIDRTGKKDSEVYKKANVDRRLFSKIMNVQGYNPSKPTAIAFAIALELNLEETKDLIGRAGYTLSKASTFDRIIEFFILERNYDIYEINEALFYFDQSLLGC